MSFSRCRFRSFVCLVSVNTLTKGDHMKANEYRYARVTDGTSIGTVRAYLPSNYTARMDGAAILIAGCDDHGWTLEGYVIPRLASGLIVANEITLENEGDSK